MRDAAIPEIPGVLSADQLTATVDAIAEWQLPSGMIPWFPGGHADPWNHVEAAMALAVGGNIADAERAYQWLVDIQRPDGSWHQYYLADRVEQDKLDANVCAYIAAGVWHHWLTTGDRGFVESMWPVVERAIDFVLDLQTPRGEILWARHADGTPWSFALVTGSSSICHSLRCAIAVAELLGHERPDWELSVARLAHTIRTAEAEAFTPKHRWAMDWYYPVLAGVLTGDEGRERLAAATRRLRDGGPRRPLRQGPALDHRRRDLRVHARPPRRRRGRDRPTSCSPGPSSTASTPAATGPAPSTPTSRTSRSTSSRPTPRPRSSSAADGLAGTSPTSHLFVDHDRLPELLDLGDEALDRD